MTLSVITFLNFLYTLLPINHMINSSIVGNYQLFLNLHLHKNEDKRNKNNCRPIAVTSIIYYQQAVGKMYQAKILISLINKI